jgi:uncharacterized protein
MQLLLYGATRMIGQRILAEAINRGHTVTAAARDPDRIQELSRVKLRQGDVLDGESVVDLARGQDAIVSAVGPGHGGDPSFLVTAARSLLAAAELSGVRLVVVGGAASPAVEPGVQPVDTTDFAATWLDTAQAHCDALEQYRSAPPAVNWCYLILPPIVELGERTGQYRVGTDRLVSDEDGRTRISAEDLAVAILDEIEQPRFRRQRFTVGY